MDYIGKLNLGPTVGSDPEFLDPLGHQGQKQLGFPSGAL